MDKLEEMRETLAELRELQNQMDLLSAETQKRTAELLRQAVLRKQRIDELVRIK